jgi:ATP-binding cassette, subfamily B, bacterial
VTRIGPLVRELPRAAPGVTAGAALLAVVGPALRVCQALLTGAVIAALPVAVQSGWATGPGHSLILRIVLLGTTYSLIELCEAVKGSLGFALQLRLDQRLRHRALAAVTLAPGIAHLEDPRLLDLVDRARRVGPGQQTPGTAARGLVQLLSRYLTVAAGFVLLLSFRWWIPFVVLALELAGRWAIGKYIHALVEVAFGQTRAMRRAQYLGDLALNPAAAKELRLFGLGPWLGTRFTDTWMAGIRVVREHRASARRLLVIPMLSGAGTGLLFYGLLARAVIDRDITIGALGMLFSAFGMVRQASSMSNADVDVALGTGAVVAVGELEDVVRAMREEMHGDRPADGLPARSIRFEDVRFSYPGTSLDVLDGFDLELRAGESLAIVGSNGAGKTTLVKLLARMYDPLEGRITIDGVDLREIEPGGWQRQIGAIFQDFTRYELTVTENVGFGARHLLDDRDALRAAAARAGALELIETLPNGWDTVLSRQVEGGTDLSGGEWQRIALARALLAVDGGARVLVLDEPTANLDARAETELYDSFLSLTSGVTTLVISHRFSTVRKADRIAVVRGGRVVELGTHDELVALGGRYARMFRLQAARFQEQTSA